MEEKGRLEFFASDDRVEEALELLLALVQSLASHLLGRCWQRWHQDVRELISQLGPESIKLVIAALHHVVEGISLDFVEDVVAREEAALLDLAIANLNVDASVVQLRRDQLGSWSLCACFHLGQGFVDDCLLDELFELLFFVGADLMCVRFFLLVVFLLLLLRGVRDKFTDDFRNFVEGPVVDIHSISYDQVREG